MGDQNRQDEERERERERGERERKKERVRKNTAGPDSLSSHNATIPLIQTSGDTLAFCGPLCAHFFSNYQQMHSLFSRTKHTSESILNFRLTKLAETR